MVPISAASFCKEMARVMPSLLLVLSVIFLIKSSASSADVARSRSINYISSLLERSTKISSTSFSEICLSISRGVKSTGKELKFKVSMGTIFTSQI